MVYNIDGERREPGAFIRKLLLLGLFSMDIYILHEPIMTIVRLVVWNRLGWNYIVCTILIFFCALCLPIPVSRYIIRRIKPLRMLLLGEKR
jgi:membrane-bound acyltransferase YfiQ involved in biofilm formation